MTNTGSFLGRGWSFPPQFNNNGQINMVSELQDIHESLTILLSTSPGERVMQADYGCALKKLVFTEINTTIITQIKSLVEEAILYFEPRISIDAIEIGCQDSMEGKIYIHILFTMISTNTRSNMVYPFYMTEGTLIGT
ncbi:MAG: GPW/gp25 family protein [Psychromonas sp.]